MEEKSSLHSSTTSQLLALSTVCYILACFWMMLKGNADVGLAGVAGIFMAFKGIYDNRKGHEQASEKGGVKVQAGDVTVETEKQNDKTTEIKT